MLSAATNGDVGQLTQLLKNNAENIKVKDNDGKSPLHLAAENGHVEAVKLLLDKKAKAAIEARDKVRARVCVEA